jgi:hypothetical protein
MPRQHKTFPILAASLENDDVCTIVSIVPFLINEFKPGIYPGRFTIQPCLDSKRPETLIVGSSVHFIQQYNGDEEMPPVVVKTTCKDIATSVVNDYLRGQMDANPDCHPGLSFVRDKISTEELIQNYKPLLAELSRKQLKWFGKLVERADNDWNRYKRHSVVSDNQRFACRALGMEKEWLTVDSNDVPIKCPACFSLCNKAAIVCANCRCVLDQEKFKKLAFAAA